jgi:hypothetical protein
VTSQRVRYRPLYFFAGEQAVISHGCTKQRFVPPNEIDRAVDRKIRFALNPLKHTWREEK